MLATKPRQIIYTDYIPVPTEQDGYCYIFLAYDKYADFIFNLGITKQVSDEIYLQQINNLLNHKDFTKYNHDFKLITAYGGYMLDQIQNLLKPHKGTVIHDEESVDKALEPVIKFMIEKMGR